MFYFSQPSYFYSVLILTTNNFTISRKIIKLISSKQLSRFFSNYQLSKQYYNSEITLVKSKDTNEYQNYAILLLEYKYSLHFLLFKKTVNCKKYKIK